MHDLLNPTLDAKIQDALALISAEWNTDPEHAAVLSNFGKDAMVMLDLFERAGIKPTILFFPEAHFPRRYAFAHRIIAKRDYTVYSFLPFATQPFKRNGQFEIVNYYQFGSTYIAVLVGLTAPVEGQPFLCGLNDLLRRPHGTADVPWKTLFVGHKASDTDPVHGSISIADDVVRAKGMKAVFPLRLFTDEDIWAYHRLRDLPVHVERYKPDGSEWEGNAYNPDKLHACTACFDPDVTAEVFCPKQQKLIRSVAPQLMFSDGRLPDYIKTQPVEGK